jgi:hypothetical protein
MFCARKMTIGSGRPTGPAVPPGRRTGVGGACTPPCAARLQLMLSLHEQFVGSRRPQPGSFPANLQDACELPHGIWRLSHMADQRHAQPAGRSLPAVTARSDDRCTRGCASDGRGKAFASAHAGQGGDGAGIERAGAACAFAFVAGFARSGDSPRFAGFGIQRNSAGTVGARRYGKIADQSWPDRIGAHFGGNGSQAFVRQRAGK